MNKKLIVLGLLISGLWGTSSLCAQTIEIADASAILEDNALREASSRYMSVLAFFLPEEATLLGIDSSNDRLNDRSMLTQTQATQAFENVRSRLKQINFKELSPSKQADYHVLEQAIGRHVWQLKQDRLSSDPLYYTQALDSIYDLLLQPKNNTRKQRLDLLNRVYGLPQLLEQAKENLTTVSPRLARLAMEKAYYAYLSFDDVTDRITNGGDFSNDIRDTAELQNKLQQAKQSLRELFELFKRLSQAESTDDLSLTPMAYTQKLADYYSIPDKADQVKTLLEKQWDLAQHQLFTALVPFDLSADEQEITIVEDLNERPVEKLPTPQDKSAKKAPQAPVYVPPTANQFYAIAGQLASPFALEDVLAAFTKQANMQAKELYQHQAIPVPAVLPISALSPYFSYQHAYVTYPAFSTFWLRVPQQGNELAKTQALKQDFNEPAVKLLINQALVPGRYYQAQQQKNRVRRLLGVPTMANGWTLYALELGKANGQLVTDEELLFAAWQNFVANAAALVDYRLHTRAYTYEDALAFLTEQNGFSTEQANRLLDAVISHPGEAVSYIAGAQYWQNAAEKYLKKVKEPGLLTAMLLEMGNVAPQDAQKELKRLYKWHTSKK